MDEENKSYGLSQWFDHNGNEVTGPLRDALDKMVTRYGLEAMKPVTKSNCCLYNPDGTRRPSTGIGCSNLHFGRCK